MTIKAIETHYAGCRFRSRLEARWAVFFDRLGIEWEYEPEGFETSAGWYLPDFRLPCVPGPKINRNVWFEVKPDNAPIDPRHEAFAREADVNLIIARGLPRDGEGQLRGENAAPLQLWLRNQWIGCAWSEDQFWSKDPFYRLDDSNRKIIPGEYISRGNDACWLGGNRLFVHQIYHGREPWLAVDCQQLKRELQLGECPQPCCAPHRGHWALLEGPKVGTAYAAARSARFEHGEKPRRNA